MLIGVFFQLQLTNNVAFIRIHIEVSLSICQEYLRDTNEWEEGPDGRPAPPPEFRQLECPLRCSDRGTCNNGMFTCMVKLLLRGHSMITAKAKFMLFTFGRSL